MAVNRSGNERDVKYMTHPWIVCRGIKHGNFNLRTIGDVWLAWGFQVNFMYKMFYNNNKNDDKKKRDDIKRDN